MSLCFTACLDVCCTATAYSLRAVLLFVGFCLLIAGSLPGTAIAQEPLPLQIAMPDSMSFEVPASSPEPSRTPSATQAAGVEPQPEPSLQIMGISGVRQVARNDWQIKIEYKISNPCVFGSHKSTISIKGTQSGKSNLTNSSTINYKPDSNSPGSFTFYVGPSSGTYSFTLTHTYSGGLGCGNKETSTTTGYTNAVYAPGDLSATADGSDQNVRLTWSRGTTGIPAASDHYYVYRDGVYVGSTSAESFNATTTPGTTNRWSIRRRYGSHQSAEKAADATTTTFKLLAGLSASEGTTVGHVATNWTNPSDYAQQTRIYRDGAVLATLPRATLNYQDDQIVPGQTYRYCLTNVNGSVETDSTCASGASFFVRAADGTDVRNVRLEWTPSAEKGATDVRIERGDRELGVVSASQASYTDRDGDPGVLYPYRVTLLDGNSEVRSDVDYGFLPATGEVSGRITTEGAQRGGVAGVRVAAIPSEETLSYALTLDGAGDYVQVPHGPALDLGPSYTVELWLRATGSGGAQTLLTKGDSASTPVRLMLDAAGHAVLYANQGTVTATSTTTVLAGTWYHIAGVVDEELMQVRLYVDGMEEAAVPLSGSRLPNDKPLTLGAFMDGARPFAGTLDEVRIWNTARPDSALAADRDRVLVGGEDGLVAYWRFNEGAGDVVGDYAHGGGHTGTVVGNPVWTDDEAPAQAYDLTSSDGQGEYRIPGLFYTFSQDGTLYEITPTKANHAFDPAVRARRLTSITSVLEGVDFTDTTSVNIGGVVQFAGTSCPIDSVEIRVDDIPLGLTDETGAFTIGGLERSEHTIQPIYRNHTFSPASIKRTLTGDVTDLLFEDTTTRTLTGYVAGGTCRADIGRARVTVTAANGCFSETVETTDQQYSFTLPAQDYTVRVEMLDDPTITFATKEVSLVDSSQVLDFTYFAPPRIELSGLPEASCGTPILEQGLTYELLIDVFEDYGATTCPATIGNLEVFDGIADDAPPLTHEMDSTGYLRYTVEAGVPNIVGGGPNPYLKRLEASVVTPGGDQTAEALAYVKGNRPREQTFTTISPQIPMLILRDPPGDQSYSYKEESRSTCYSSSLSLLADASVGVFSKVKAGTQFETGIFGVSFETKVWGSLSASLEVGARALGQSEREVCLTHTNRYSTSGNQDITGTSGDVFVGAAMNIVYALTDVLDVEEQGNQCTVNLSKSIVYDNDGFATQYHYTESHIRNTVIPDLELNRELATESKKKQEFEDQIEVWNETLALNERLKAQAVPMGDQHNLSFSANAPTEQITEWQVTDRESFQFNLYMNSEVVAEAGVEIGGVGASGGVRVRASLDVGTSEQTTTTTTNRTGFYLADDDQGDAFSVDVKRDPVYGTPVFDLVSGVSSAPWEPGTLPRDGVDLTLSPATQTLADPAGTAEVILSLGNTGQNNEGRSYELVFLQESNPDAARIEIGGSSYQGPIPYSLDDGEARQVTLRLTREASSAVYDFQDLQLVLRSPADLQFADTAAFSVHFESPCSPITLFEPADGWIVNRAANDSLRIVLQDYDPARLARVRLERTPKGSNNWSEAFSIPVADLPEESTIRFWRTGSQDDGAYDLRAVTECEVDGQAALTYSAQSTGTIDRQPPRLFGSPEPADGGILTGETFTATFNEPIACDAVSAENVVLEHTASGQKVATETACSDKAVAVTVTDDLAAFENETLQVTLRTIPDAYGNAMAEPASWSFRVNRNPVGWTRASLAHTYTKGEAVTLTNSLANRGDDAATFSLAQFPDWLTPSTTRGTVEPGAEVPIAFDADATLEVGVHTGKVVATTPGGDEALHVTLEVQCEAPDWSFDASAFAHSMTITAGFYVGEEPVAEAGDRVAALVGEEVRGVATVQRVVPQDEYAAFLTAYSNAADGETLSFLFFDASECETRTTTETVAFEADASVGSASALEPFTVSGAVLQQIDLLAGWTWISLGVEATDMSTETVLRRLSPADGDLVKGQTGYGQYVAGTGWVGTLDTLHSGATYKLRLADEEALRFIGEPVPASDRPLPVVPGWNWIGYLPDASLTVDEALASLASTATTDDILKGQLAFASFDGAGWQGALQRMNSGEGYLLKAQTSGTLTYPGAAGKQAVFATHMSARALLGQAAPDWTVDAAAFEHSMTVTGALHLPEGRSVNPDLLLLAFAGDDVRGMATPAYVLGGWMYFLTVYGDEANEPITFRAYDPEADALLDIEGTEPFEADAGLGTPRELYAFYSATSTAVEDGAVPTEFALEANYPNPFNPQTTIRYALKQAAHVRLEIYNTLGQRVAMLVDEQQPAGWQETTFEAGSFASGVYLYRIQAGDFTQVRRMVLLK